MYNNDDDTSQSPHSHLNRQHYSSNINDVNQFPKHDINNNFDGDDIDYHHEYQNNANNEDAIEEILPLYHQVSTHNSSPHRSCLRSHQSLGYNYPRRIRYSHSEILVYSTEHNILGGIIQTRRSRDHIYTIYNHVICSPVVVFQLHLNQPILEDKNEYKYDIDKMLEDTYTRNHNTIDLSQSTIDTPPVKAPKPQARRRNSLDLNMSRLQRMKEEVKQEEGEHHNNTKEQIYLQTPQSQQQQQQQQQQNQYDGPSQQLSFSIKNEQITTTTPTTIASTTTTSATTRKSKNDFKATTISPSESLNNHSELYTQQEIQNPTVYFSNNTFIKQEYTNQKQDANNQQLSVSSPSSLALAPSNLSLAPSSSVSSSALAPSSLPSSSAFNASSPSPLSSLSDATHQVETQSSLPSIQSSLSSVQSSLPPVQFSLPPVQSSLPPVQSSLPPVQSSLLPVQSSVPQPSTQSPLSPSSSSSSSSSLSSSSSSSSSSSLSSLSSSSPLSSLPLSTERQIKLENADNSSLESSAINNSHYAKQTLASDSSKDNLTKKKNTHKRQNYINNTKETSQISPEVFSNNSNDKEKQINTENQQLIESLQREIEQLRQNNINLEKTNKTLTEKHVFLEQNINQLTQQCQSQKDENNNLERYNEELRVQCRNKQCRGVLIISKELCKKDQTIKQLHDRFDLSLQQCQQYRSDLDCQMKLLQQKEESYNVLFNKYETLQQQKTSRSQQTDNDKETLTKKLAERDEVIKKLQNDLISAREETLSSKDIEDAQIQKLTTEVNRLTRQNITITHQFEQEKLLLTQKIDTITRQSAKLQFSRSVRSTIAVSKNLSNFSTDKNGKKSDDSSAEENEDKDSVNETDNNNKDSVNETNNNTENNKKIEELQKQVDEHIASNAQLRNDIKAIQLDRDLLYEKTISLVAEQKQNNFINNKEKSTINELQLQVNTLQNELDENNAMIETTAEKMNILLGKLSTSKNQIVSLSSLYFNKHQQIAKLSAAIYALLPKFDNCVIIKQNNTSKNSSFSSLAYQNSLEMNKVDDYDEDSSSFTINSQDNTFHIQSLLKALSNTCDSSKTWRFAQNYEISLPIDYSTTTQSQLSSYIQKQKYLLPVYIENNATTTTTTNTLDATTTAYKIFQYYLQHLLLASFHTNVNQLIIVNGPKSTGKSHLLYGKIHPTTQPVSMQGLLFIMLDYYFSQYSELSKLCKDASVNQRQNENIEEQQPKKTKQIQLSISLTVQAITPSDVSYDLISHEKQKLSSPSFIPLTPVEVTSTSVALHVCTSAFNFFNSLLLNDPHNISNSNIITYVHVKISSENNTDVYSSTFAFLDMPYISLSNLFSTSPHVLSQSTSISLSQPQPLTLTPTPASLSSLSLFTEKSSQLAQLYTYLSQQLSPTTSSSGTLLKATTATVVPTIPNYMSSYEHLFSQQPRISAQSLPHCLYITTLPSCFESDDTVKSVSTALQYAFILSQLKNNNQLSLSNNMNQQQQVINNNPPYNNIKEEVCDEIPLAAALSPISSQASSPASSSTPPASSSAPLASSSAPLASSSTPLASVSASTPLTSTMVSTTTTIQKKPRSQQTISSKPTLSTQISRNGSTLNNSQPLRSNTVKPIRSLHSSTSLISRPASSLSNNLGTQQQQRNISSSHSINKLPPPSRSTTLINNKPSHYIASNSLQKKTSNSSISHTHSQCPK